jgi:hypothetical protein
MPTLSQSDWIAVFVGLVGIGAGWLIARLFYKRSIDDLEKSNSGLRQQLTEISRDIHDTPGRAAELMRFKNLLDVGVAAGPVIAPVVAPVLSRIIGFFLSHPSADVKTPPSTPPSA